VQSSFLVTFPVTLEGTRAQKLTTVVRENGDFCHPVLGFGLIVKRGKKKLKNVPLLQVQ